MDNEVGQKHAMGQKGTIKLVTVEETFMIEGRGVVVTPVVSSYEGPMSIRVILHKPGGGKIEAKAQLGFVRFLDRGKRGMCCSLPGLGKSDVPVGTEIWIEQGDPAK